MSMTKDEIQAVIEEKLALSLKNHANVIDEAVDEISDIVNEFVENVFWIHILFTVAIFILIFCLYLFNTGSTTDHKSDQVQNVGK